MMMETTPFFTKPFIFFGSVFTENEIYSDNYNRKMPRRAHRARRKAHDNAQGDVGSYKNFLAI